MLTNVALLVLITGVSSTVVHGSVRAGHYDDDGFLLFCKSSLILVSHEPVNNSLKNQRGDNFAGLLPILFSPYFPGKNSPR